MSRHALRLALALERAELLAQKGDPAPGHPAVGLELRLAGAPRADAAAEALEVLPHASHPRKVVLELRELDLELALRRSRMLGEDVEYQLRPIDDAQLERVLEAPLLARIEVVVHHEGLRPGLRHRGLQLLEAALAEVGARVGSGPTLHDLADGLDAGRAHQLAYLPELLVGVDLGSQRRDQEGTLRLGAGRRIRLVLAHVPALCPVARPATSCGSRAGRATRWK